MDRYDLVTAAGLISLVAGLWLLAPWIALTFGGLAGIMLGLAGARIAETSSTDGESGS